MDNFFSYISKPVSVDDIDLWVDKNNICYNKLDLFRDFVFSVIDLIYETYLGDEENGFQLSEEDNHRHFKWCWDKTVDNFKKESVYFDNDTECYLFVKSFVDETFYNQKITEVKNSLTKFFLEVFDLERPHTYSDLDLLLMFYKNLDKSLINNLQH
jgi:hypothetical protein